jgi:para-nitrobenzyl esterase
MDMTLPGSRRALLKAGVAFAGLAATGALGACSPSPTPAASTTPAGDPIVQTTAGKVRGFVEDGVLGFKGVRYGADTGGANRFAAPQPPTPWTETLDANAYGASAPQAVAGDGGGLFQSWRPNPPPPNSEDCLFLNVWTPAADANKRAVLVWFHGGGWSTGSGSSNAYDGVRLAKRGDVVVVTVNHRLNVFGYTNLAKYGPQYADSGFAGVLDMVHSLKWVKDNIAAFGGDPDKVLIFGQSGGGLKVCTLMATDSAKGLFHRAVPQSGPGIRLAEPAASATGADAFVAKLGLTAATIDQIRTKTTAEIQAAAEGVAGVGSPVMDGKNITRHPFDPDGPPQSADVPMLIGVTRTEGTSLEARNPALFDLTWETLVPEIRRLFPGKDAAKIIALYKEKHPNIGASELYFMAGSDNRFFRGSVTVADRKAAQNAAKVWFYELDWTTPVMDGKRYVPHALDIGMIFDNVQKSASMSGTSPAAQHIADMMSETWIAFAKTGDPGNPMLPAWPNYTAAQRNMMIFRDQPGVEVDVRAAERAATA